MNALPVDKERPLDALQETHKKFRKELSAGTVSLVLLSLLGQAGEPMYGYQIGRLIGAGEEDSAMVKQGAIYPVLRSLEGRGLLSSEREASVDGPPRRYYRVTETGRQALVTWQEIWTGTKAFVDNVLGGEFK